MAVGLALAGLSAQAAVGTQAAPNMVNLGPIASPSTLIYSNTFSAPTSEKFYDDFTFSLSPESSFSSITASINLGNFFSINNISVRLFQGSGPFAGNATPLIQAWSAPFSAAPGLTGSTTVISVASLLASTYTLEVRGDVVGLSGGSYLGFLNVAPVPEPETYAMLLAGLGIIGTIVRRRKPNPS